MLPSELRVILFDHETQKFLKLQEIERLRYSIEIRETSYPSSSKKIQFSNKEYRARLGIGIFSYEGSLGM